MSRTEEYYRYLATGKGAIPKPLTREEQYLYAICTELDPEALAFAKEYSEIMDGYLEDAQGILEDIEEVQESIPQDYSTLSSDVTELKEDLIALEQHGYPMASISEAVDAWADAHEAEIVNAYVTPEMYGAVGDGITDDTSAVQSALDADGVCVLAKKYSVSSTLVISVNNKSVMLNGTINYTGNASAVEITGARVALYGNGFIYSNGTHAIDVKSSKNFIGGLYIQCGTSNCVSVINIVSSSSGSGRTHNVFERLSVLGGTNGSPVGYGINIGTSSNGYVNENKFDKINLLYCTYGIVMANGSSAIMNHNKFMMIDTESSTKSLKATSSSNKQIVDNIFEFRTQELGEQTFEIDKNFVGNRMKMGFIRPKFFKVVNADAKALFTSTMPSMNLIEGSILSNSGSPLGFNGGFHVNGDTLAFFVNSARNTSNEIKSTHLDGNNVLQFDYTKNWYTNYPVGYFLLASALTDIVFDLNYISDWCSSPMKYIQVKNSSGTNVTIKNDSTVLFAQTALAKGIYRCVYSGTRDSIMLVQETTV